MFHRTFTNRFEIKYLVSQQKAKELKKVLGELLQIDKNSQNISGYYNYSIYFDSPGYFFYRQKKEGQLKRIKPRLRTHLFASDSTPEKWYLELKGKYGATVQKRRALVSLKTAQKLVKGVDFDPEPGGEVLFEFEYMWRRFSLRPAVTVLYFREPFNSPMFPNLRITFDYRIAGNLDFSLISSGERMNHIINSDQVLVELKFTDSIPRFVNEIFRCHQMEQITFSKFARCLEVCLDSLPGISGKRQYRPIFDL